MNINVYALINEYKFAKVSAFGLYLSSVVSSIFLYPYLFLILVLSLSVALTIFLVHVYALQLVFMISNFAFSFYLC